MSFSIRLKALLTVFALLLFWGMMNLDNVADAQREGKCGTEIPCRDEGINYCIPLPTSLPPVDLNKETRGYGFQSASDNCGAKRCYFFFSCVCGPALGASICYNYGNGFSSCDQKKTFEKNGILKSSYPVLSK